MVIALGGLKSSSAFTVLYDIYFNLLNRYTF